MSLRQSLVEQKPEKRNKNKVDKKQEKAVNFEEYAVEVKANTIPAKIKKKTKYPGLRSINDLPPDEAYAARSLGAKRGLETRREKASIKRCMEILLDMPVTDKETIQEMEKIGVDVTGLTYKMLLAIGIMKRATKGSVSAFQEIRDVIGENKGISVEDLGLNIMVTRALRENLKEGDEAVETVD